MRRLRDAYQPGHAQGSDIAPGQTIRAAQLSEALGVHHYISGVYTHANNVILTQHLDSCKLAVNQIRPAVVVIQAGSNDLAQLSHFDANAVLQTATQIYQFASSLREKFDTPIIIINAILSNISSDADTFRQLSTEFNKIIKNFCDGRNIIYNKLRGFANYYINNIEYPRPVHSWSHDGIHCDQASMAHYKRRVAHSILDNTYHLYL